MRNTQLPAPLVTREHGSWAVLIMPMLMSLIVVGKWEIDFAWLFLSALGIFLCYVPAQRILRQYPESKPRVDELHQAQLWGSAYAVVGFGFAGVLVLRGYLLLLSIGSAGILFFLVNFFLTKRFSKSVSTDLLAVAGLTLSGPAAYYVLAGQIDRRAFVLYILTFLFFGCSVFYVHMKIRASATKKQEMNLREKLLVGRLNLLYLALVTAIVGMLAAMHLTPVGVMVAFVPMIVHGIYGTIKLSSNIRFRNIGLILLSQAIVFTALISLLPWKS